MSNIKSVTVNLLIILYFLYDVGLDDMVLESTIAQNNFNNTF